MTVCELIEKLIKFDLDMEVTILRGFNGQGQPRRINFGPVLEKFDEEAFNKALQEPRPRVIEEQDRSDLENEQATEWVTMGYGCY